MNKENPLDKAFDRDLEGALLEGMRASNECATVRNIGDLFCLTINGRFVPARSDPSMHCFLVEPRSIENYADLPAVLASVVEEMGWYVETPSPSDCFDFSQGYPVSFHALSHEGGMPIDANVSIRKRARGALIILEETVFDD